jgi:ketosteroid isomerase-like protein
MSENSDLVRSIMADWERGDFSSAGWADPEIEYVIVGGPSPGTWTGLTGLAEGFRDFVGGLEAFRLEAEASEAYYELDGERVLVLARFSGRGKTSGLELGETHATVAQLFHVREGKVTRMISYFDRDRAFDDLGLEA